MKITFANLYATKKFIANVIGQSNSKSTNTCSQGQTSLSSKLKIYTRYTSNALYGHWGSHVGGTQEACSSCIPGW